MRRGHAPLTAWAGSSRVAKHHSVAAHAADSDPDHFDRHHPERQIQAASLDPELLSFGAVARRFQQQQRGYDDILWRSDAGQLSNWLGQANGGFTNNDANAFASVPTGWQVVAVGDYNGDGFDDILWRSDSGQLSNWLGTEGGGFTNNDANAFAAAPTSWHVQPLELLV